MEIVSKTTKETPIYSAFKGMIIDQFAHYLENDFYCSSIHSNDKKNQFTEMEMPIQKSLIHMEQTGMGVDRNALDALSEKISDYIGELEQEIFRLNGKRFSVNSSKAVAQALGIRKKNGSMAAKCTRVQLLQSNHPMAKWILEHRSLHAILSKSIQPLIKKITNNNR